MHQARPSPIGHLVVALATLVLLVGSCANGEEAAATEAGGDTSDGGGGAGTGGSNGLGSDALPNACPVEGCQIFITSAEASGAEIELTFEANFTPDFERNHIHVFWDSQPAGAVGSDFAERGFAEQGKWHPTDEYPGYVTQADASVASESRQGSTVVCATAGDTDHAVIDPGLVACRDVSSLVS
jgi:hypothetical protein